MRAVIILCLSFFYFQVSVADNLQPDFVLTKEMQQSLSPEKALQKLMDGNQRFLEGQNRTYNTTELMKATAKQGQFPFAFIFSCIDSRSIAEMLFDQSIGNLFVGRIAGNVADPNVLASMEYSTKFVGSKVVVVMGHTSCGAISAACSNVQVGNITKLLENIQPAVAQVEKQQNSKDCKDPQLIDAIAKQNVINQLNYIYQHSPIISEQVDKKSIALIGAMHDINTGKISFFDRSGQEIQMPKANS